MGDGLRDVLDPKSRGWGGGPSTPTLAPPSRRTWPRSRPRPCG